MTSWHSPQKILTFGHAHLSELFSGPGVVYVQEKIDGSFFQFGVFDGKLRVRSKGREIDLYAPDKMFEKAVEQVYARQGELVDGWTYRGEYLRTPHHNALTYDRVPKGYVILFDVLFDQEDYLRPLAVVGEAHRLGFEVAPTYGIIGSPVGLDDYLEKSSVLGGQKIEGVVLKNYSVLGRDGKALFAKYVSPAFKEVHAREWRRANPTNRDVVEQLISELRTPARVNKAIQHLDEGGALDYAPQDIPLVLAEVREDIRAECEEHVKQRLFDWAWPKISRAVIAGAPEHYKAWLASRAIKEGQ